MDITSWSLRKASFPCLETITIYMWLRRRALCDSTCEVSVERGYERLNKLVISTNESLHTVCDCWNVELQYKGVLEASRKSFRESLDESIESFS